MMMQNADDRPAERIRWLEEENKRLEGRLLAANREIERMHQQVLLAKAAAKEATSEVSSTCHAVYIGAALKLGTSVSPTAREVVLPYIDQSLAEKYTLSIRRNDKTRTMVVRVEEKGGV